MSNPLANNAVVTRPNDKNRYLKVTRDGIPINKQVPRTYQTYTGTGGNLTYDGSSEIRINGSGLTTPLTILFGALPNVRNWVGRELAINIYTPNAQTITLNTSPAFMSINGTNLTQLSHVIPVDGISKTVTIYFSSVSQWSVDYGAAAGISILSLAIPRVGAMGSTYVYGTDTFIALPIFFIPDNKTYDVLYNNLEPTSEGTITPFISTVSGPSFGIAFFSFQPAPRRTDTTLVTGYLTISGIPYTSFSIPLAPLLDNVYDHEYFTGAQASGNLAMYDPLVNSGGVQLALDANGDKVTTISDLLAVAIDVADSLVFSVSSSDTKTINWKSYTTYKEGVLLDVSTLNPGTWNAGDSIVDIDFDDKASSLLVLPNNPTTGKILRIPIKPYNNADPNNVYTGVLLGGTFDVGFNTVLHSIAVCPITRSIYVACKPLLFTNSVYILKPFPDLADPFSYQHPTINTGRTSITFTSLGSLLILYENTLELVRINNTRPLSTNPLDTTVLYTLTEYHTSLSRNCYAWRQG